MYTTYTVSFLIRARLDLSFNIYIYVYAHAYIHSRKKRENIIIIIIDICMICERRIIFTSTYSRIYNECLLTCPGNLNPIRSSIVLLVLFEWQIGRRKKKRKWFVILHVYKKKMKREREGRPLAMSIGWFPLTNKGTDWVFFLYFFFRKQTDIQVQHKSRKKRTRCNLCNCCRPSIERLIDDCNDN